VLYVCVLCILSLLECKGHSRGWGEGFGEKKKVLCIVLKPWINSGQGIYCFVPVSIGEEIYNMAA